ncbi:hypothetical protein [Staphylococcus simulans]|uniref:hypothetical protein n=1 Tax=Staphylococcus simulans TaxID=1286 RepID=UPI00399AA69F
MKEPSYQITNAAYLMHIISKLNPRLTLEELQSEHLTYATLMNYLNHLLNSEEKALIDTLLNATVSIITLTRKEYQALTHLKETRYIFPIGKNRYYVTPEFLNDYNQFCLNHKYKPLPILDHWTHNQLISLSKLEITRRFYDTKDFETCLSDAYDTKNLDFICVMANIPSYDQLSNSEKCRLIAERVKKDYGLFEKLIQLVPPLRILFSYMVYEDRNSFVGAELPGDNIAIFILFSDKDLNMLYLPCDLFEHLKHYFSLRGLQPEEILKQSIEDFTDQSLESQQQHALIQAVCHNELTIEEGKMVIPALMHDTIPKNILSQLNTDTKTKFFEALVNLFGFIPIKIVVKLYNRYFETHETIESIRKLINEDFKSPTTMINQHYLTHVTLKDAYQTLDTLYETVPYYLPETLKALFKAAANENWIANKKFNDSFIFLKSHINLQGASFDIPVVMVEAAIFEDVILPNIKMVPHEDDLKDAVQMWKAQGLYNQVKSRQVLKHVKIIYSMLRLWVYRGHTKREYNEMIHQYHTHSTSNIEDWHTDTSH